MMNRLLRNIFVAGLMLAPALAAAQTPDPVQFIVAPETPAPNSVVQIQVQGVGSFLGDANITWTLNGEVALEGAGASIFSFKTGALGSVSRVKMNIDSDTQGTITRTFAFSPSLVNMVWEADTTVPPLLRAKPLYSAGSSLRVLAFPVVYSGQSRIAASSLSFHWSAGDSPLTAVSGLGKNILSINGDQLQASEEVSVDVYFGNTKVAHGEVSVLAVNPGIMLYEKDALRGLITDAAIPESIGLSGKEITLQAEPLYFSTAAKRDGALEYSWTLGGEDTVGPLSSQGVLTLRQTGSGAGSATVGVSLQNTNTDQFVQAAQTLVQMVFGQSAGLLQSLFGI